MKDKTFIILLAIFLVIIFIWILFRKPNEKYSQVQPGTYIPYDELKAAGMLSNVNNYMGPDPLAQEAINDNRGMMDNSYVMSRNMISSANIPFHFGTSAFIRSGGSDNNFAGGDYASQNKVHLHTF